MIDFIKTKRNYIMALALLFVFVSLSETTYSLFLKSDNTDEFNYNTGLLDIEFIESEKLVLENTFPLNDSDGIKGTPYVLKLKNTGTLPYLFDLKMLANDETNSIDYKYIKVSINDNLPNTLYKFNNVIASNQIIYPNEEITFNIRIWLDKNIPNNELGKSFEAKITATGRNIYKTLDSSGANHPIINDNLIPVYYSTIDNAWHTADKINLNSSYKWYDYDNKMWANSVLVKDSPKYIFDITRKHDIKISDITFNNSNIIFDNKYLDTGISNYSDNYISGIFRINFNKNTGKQYILSNDKISYYYDFNNHRFYYIINGNTLVSNQVNIVPNKWNIVGFTYNGSTFKFYLNGDNIGLSNVNGDIKSTSSFKLGTDSNSNVVSNMILGDVLIYNRLLSDNEIKNNYSTSINIINDGLFAGYREFTPMTLNEYYHFSNLGTTILDKDINSSYVWIPRFKYMVWNVLGENGIDAYNAYQKGINISFENNTETSGVIKCQNGICYGDTNGINQLTNIDNGKYYTHNAFSKTSGEVNGFWTSKYEVSLDNNQNITSNKGSDVWRNSSLSDYYRATKNMNNQSSIIKNSEWGAISYLTHSKYGICSNNTCLTVKPNNSYKSGNNIEDSTTGNIYGVFDMAGSASEFVMTTYQNDAVVTLDGNILAGIPISNDDYEINKVDSFILGDATKELSLENGIWNDDSVNDNNESWIIRGGNATGNFKGLFAYGTSSEEPKEYLSTRIVIK